MLFINNLIQQQESANTRLHNQRQNHSIANYSTCVCKVCMYSYLHSSTVMHICMYAYMYISICVCMNIYVYMYACIYALNFSSTRGVSLVDFFHRIANAIFGFMFARYAYGSECHWFHAKLHVFM